MDRKRVLGRDAEVSAEELEALTGLNFRRPDVPALAARSEVAALPAPHGHRTRRARRRAQRRRPGAVVLAVGAVVVIAALAAAGVLILR